MNAASLPFALLIGAVTAAATTIGGTLALRVRTHRGLLFGFSSGAVVGVALLDLLPEALDLAEAGRPAFGVMTAAACGFAAYYLFDRFAAVLFGQHGDHARHVGPGSLSMHSLIDGLGIGLAFHVSAGAGIVVAVAVLAHDFLDGANTVTLSLAGGGDAPIARRWLAVDALAPIAGIALAQALALSNNVLAGLLALFAGGFLYIGAGQLLPRSRDGEAGLGRVVATTAGMTFIYAVVRLAAL